MSLRSRLHDLESIEGMLFNHFSGLNPGQSSAEPGYSVFDRPG